MSFTILGITFGSAEPPQPPEKILNGALQALRDHKYREFEGNIENYINAFEALFKKSPRRAIRLFMSIEKERPKEKAPHFFGAAVPKITETLQRLLPAERRDIYGTILEAHPKANLAPFLVSHSRDISQFLKLEMGVKLTQRILEHAGPEQPAQQQILSTYAEAFGALLKSMPVAGLDFITKQLCKAHREAKLPLPPYLDQSRAAIVDRTVGYIISKATGGNVDFAEINSALSKIVGWGISNDTRITEFKPSDIYQNCNNLTLFQIRLKNVDSAESQNLYVLCCAGRNKTIGHKTSMDNGKLTTLLVGTSLNDLQMAFGLMGRPITERTAMDDMIKKAQPLSFVRPIGPAYKSASEYITKYEMPPEFLGPTKTPAYTYLLARSFTLTVSPDSLNLENDRVSYPPLSWNLQSLQFNPDGQIQ